MTRYEAAMHYRAGVKLVIDRYTTQMRVTWAAYGKPTTSERCKRDMQRHWQELKANLATLGRLFDGFPIASKDNTLFLEDKDEMYPACS